MDGKYKNIILITIFLIGLLFVVKGGVHSEITAMPADTLAIGEEYTWLLSPGIASPELPILEQAASCAMIGSMIETIREKQGNNTYLYVLLSLVFYISLLTLSARLKSGLFAYLILGIKVIDSLLSQIQIIHQMDGKKRKAALL